MGDFTRTGGMLGTAGSGGGATSWGSIGYKGSNSVYYGVYGSNGYASGGGYLAESARVGTGGGFYGNVVGSWSKSALIGSMNEGELMAQYNLGNVYTKGHQADIVTVNNKRVAAYSNTSLDLQITKAGTGNLTNGRATIAFEGNFSGMLEKGSLPVVTVTPVGNCNGIHLVSISSEGFVVEENNSGSSNVPFTYIVIGKRVDAAEATLPEVDIAKSDFDANVKAYMFNESNKEQSAKPMWWDGAAIRFDATPAEPARDQSGEAEFAAKIAKDANAVNQAIEQSNSKSPVQEMSPNAPKADQFEKNPKIVKEADLKVIDPRAPVKTEDLEK